MQHFKSDSDVVDRVLSHVQNKTTDRGKTVWRESVDHYRSQERLERERALIRRSPTVFCPAAALKEKGDFIARVSGGTPLIAVRCQDGQVRAFVNACRHRGAQLAAGRGCAGQFTCPYHGWTYSLDGFLLGVPHKDGFPDLDKSDHGLAEVTAIEKHGLIFVLQEPHDNALSILEGMPDMLASNQHLFVENDGVIEANWKLYLESFIEGYHIKPAHPETFYPFGYDNLNVIEFSGLHTRVTFPFRRIEQLADVPPEDRTVSDKLTYVYHLFPNVIVAKLTHHVSVGIIEPVDPATTRVTFYSLTKPADEKDKEAAIEDAKRDLAFVNGTGQVEDIAAVTGIQRSIETNANDVLTFGQFEPAIVHFHKNLTAMLEKA